MSEIKTKLAYENALKNKIKTPELKGASVFISKFNVYYRNRIVSKLVLTIRISGSDI
jgi:hypothetical protein